MQEKNQDEYQTVKIKRNQITSLKDVIHKNNIAVRSDAEAVNLAINYFILAHKENQSEVD